MRALDLKGQAPVLNYLSEKHTQCITQAKAAFMQYSGRFDLEVFLNSGSDNTLLHVVIL